MSSTPSLDPIVAEVTVPVTPTEAEGGTLVHLEHGGWGAGSEDVRATYTHWGQLLDRYAAHVS